MAKMTFLARRYLISLLGLMRGFQELKTVRKSLILFTFSSLKK